MTMKSTLKLGSTASVSPINILRAVSHETIIEMSFLPVQEYTEL